MNCMKCGRETGSEQVFCEDCLLEMEKYPVKPGTAVQLPKRNDNAARKAPKRRTVPLEEQVKALKKRVRIQSILILLLLALAAAMLYPTVEYLQEDHFLPGQNYTAIVPSNPQDGSSSAAGAQADK